MSTSDTRQNTATATEGLRDPHVIEVGIGELMVAEAPTRLIAPALGSCVGLALYDPFTKRGGLAHIMLPGPANGDDARLGRFADWAVPELIRMMTASGSLKLRIQARIAGGAAMFRSEKISGGVGERNVKAVKAQLALMSIPLLAEDTGEAHARTLEVALDTGEVVVRSYQYGVRRLQGPGMVR